MGSVSDTLVHWMGYYVMHQKICVSLWRRIRQLLAWIKHGLSPSKYVIKSQATWRVEWPYSMSRCTMLESMDVGSSRCIVARMFMLSLSRGQKTIFSIGPIGFDAKWRYLRNTKLTGSTLSGVLIHATGISVHVHSFRFVATRQKVV